MLRYIVQTPAERREPFGRTMVEILELDGGKASPPHSGRATPVLEAGGLVLLASRRFQVRESERAFLDPAVLSKSKNVSLDPHSGRLSGTRLAGAAGEALAAMIGRFSQEADALLAELTPTYGPRLQKRRTSFRPGAVEQRALSARKDDRRLHVDAFPSSPVQGRRILRVFANIDPLGRPRLWDVGEDDFETVARRYADRLRPKGGARLLERLGLTRGRRTPYDQAMLDLHDATKLDHAYQADAPRRRLAFPAGSMWVVYTDAALHAALSGQHALEQTYLLAPEAMQQEARAPVRVLERVLDRPLL